MTTPLYLTSCHVIDLLSASRLREEVTLLEGHTRGAGVRCIVRVDGNMYGIITVNVLLNRFASGGDDGMICIWSGGTKPSAMLGGMYLLTTDSSVDDASDGKRAAVMSMLALNANTLIAGYADKTIRVRGDHFCHHHGAGVGSHKFLLL